jgi:hypothetical protein
MLSQSEKSEARTVPHCECVRHDTSLLVAERFRKSGYRPLRSIDCNVCGAIARLTGTVPSFYLRQVAQEITVNTPGVELVENEIQVCKSSSNQQTGTADCRSSREEIVGQLTTSFATSARIGAEGNH